jgi:hypothetical protein
MPSRFCTCDHRQDQHVRSARECREDLCVCRKFVSRHAIPPLLADVQAEAAAAVLEIVEIQPPAAADLAGQPTAEVADAARAAAEELPTIGHWPDGDDELSTSALLAKAERERDSLARRCAVRFEEAEKLRAELSNALQCFDELQTAAGRKYQELGAERDEALAEIERLRTAVPRPTPHLDRVKAERDEALRDLAALRESLNGSASTASDALDQRDELAAELKNVRSYIALIIEATGLQADHTGAIDVVGWITEKRTELDNLRTSRHLAERRVEQLENEQHRRDQQDGTAVFADDIPAGYVAVPSGLLLDSSPRWFCQPITGCGEVYDQEQEGGRCKCGHLIVPVTVTITMARPR